MTHMNKGQLQLVLFTGQYLQTWIDTALIFHKSLKSKLLPAITKLKEADLEYILSV